MTSLPIDLTSRVRLPVLALGRYRGAVVLELTRRTARRPRPGQPAVDRAARDRDALLALRRGAGV